MSSVAEAIERGSSTTEIDDDQEEAGECVEAEMGAEPGKAEASAF